MSITLCAAHSSSRVMRPPTFVLLVVALLICLAIFVNGAPDEISVDQVVSEDLPQSDVTRAQRKKDKPNRKGKRDSPERSAIAAWADSLQSIDYEETHWREMFHSNGAGDFFNGYAKRMSALFKSAGAKINFALIGACDGLGDKTIKKLYLPNEHWRGVFVEPMSINVRDLVQFLADKKASQRSVVIRAAATSKCLNDTILVERPLYEEKNASLPHWLRRQIGSVLPKHRNHARNEWTIEEVRCVTARDVMREWAKLSPTKHNLDMRRPHILKIDVEGHDFDVLMGFFTYNVKSSELPLIVEFEAKSIGKKYPEAKARMEELGYAVTEFGQDGFAILKKERVFDSLNPLVR